ncbi:hypothetical protein [Paenibacillus sp. 1P03SA]|uniref:hypothetical protein n=1 Tax=Paenibacillus sp. 1P03SA TaxID=3132294 RepID=UPI0039A047BE
MAAIHIESVQFNHEKTATFGELYVRRRLVSVTVSASLVASSGLTMGIVVEVPPENLGTDPAELVKHVIKQLADEL